MLLAELTYAFCNITPTDTVVLGTGGYMLYIVGVRMYFSYLIMLHNTAHSFL